MDADDSMDIRFFLSLALRRKGRSAVDDLDFDFEGFLIFEQTLLGAAFVGDTVS